MPSGLSNTPAAFQAYVNHDLGYDAIDVFAICYIDDILIHSDTLEKHKTHVRTIISRLKEASMPIDLDKSEFHVRETKFLGLIMSQIHLRPESNARPLPQSEVNMAERSACEALRTTINIASPLQTTSLD